MKTTDPALLAHFGQSTTTLAVLWKLERLDSGVLGFTTHDKDIVWDSLTYQADTGMVNTARESKDDMTVDNMEVTAFLDSATISEDDIRAGLYDYAVVETAVINWADTSMGIMRGISGTLGQLKMRNGVITAEIRGKSQRLSTVIGAIFGPRCRAILGSGLNGIDEGTHYPCGIDITAFRQSGTVNSSADAVTVVPAAGLLKVGSASPTDPADAGWFDFGVLAFTSGAMNNFKVEIKSWDGTTAKLYLPMPYQPQAGDTFVIEPGCNHLGGSTGDCFVKYNNIVNFKGETWIPGMDKILQYPNPK